MTTLADKVILSGVNNRPPMLEKDMYDSWKSRMELYMMNIQHGRMILESERECKLYNEFDNFAYKKGESLSHHNVYNPSSSIPQVEYAPSVNQQPDFSQPDSGLIVPVFQKADDLDACDSDCDEINTAKFALMANLSHYGFDDLAEQSVNSEEPNPSTRPTQVEVPKELFKVSMMNISLKKLKHHLASFDVVVKERTTATAITEGTWGFKHTKACFRDEIIPFVKALKDLFNSFDQFLIDELSEVQNVFHQMKQAVEQHRPQEKDMVIKKLKERIKSLSGNMKEDKSKQELKEIETINIELDHRVTKLIVENEHLKQTYNLQEKVLVITALKDNLRKLKGKVMVDEAVILHPIDPELRKIDVSSLAPKLQNNRTAHYDYLKHTQEEIATLREIVEHERSLNPLNTSLDYAYKVNLPTSASGSQPSCNTKKDKIQQTPSSAKKNKLEAYPMNVRSSLQNKKSVVNTKDIESVQNSKLNVNYDLQCVTCNGCLFSDNHDSCVLEFINTMNARVKSKSVKKPLKRKVWKPTGKVFTNIGYKWRTTGRTFTIVGNVCPLTRITTTAKVTLRKPIALVSNTPKPVVVQIVLWYLDSGCSKHMTGDRSQLTNFVKKFLGTIKFGNDHVAKIMGYGEYQIGNVTISRVYFVEGLGHNLFSVGQFCDLDLEVAFRQHTCFIRNLEGVDLLTGSRGNNLYNLSLGDMMASSSICLLSKASKTKSWLWHQHLSHLNFSAINYLARQGLVRGLPNLKFAKDCRILDHDW
nr:integrase, catalytic region, zinc finger, CCHC-type, peptidase aspartic, catalytic [Tanacetum cinerariifolium]